MTDARSQIATAVPTAVSPPPRLEGWRLVSLLVVVIAPSLGALSAMWLAPGPVGNAIYTVCKLTLYATPVLAFLLEFDRRARRAELTTQWREGVRPKALLLGAGGGFVIVGLILLAWFAPAPIDTRGRIDPDELRELATASGLAEPLRYLALATWLSFGNAFLEELTFRWFVGRRLAHWGRWRADLTSAGIFTLHHIIVVAAYLPGVLAAIAALGIFIGGLIWSWTMRRTGGSILPCYLGHALVDIAVLWIGWRIISGASSL